MARQVPDTCDHGRRWTALPQAWTEGIARHLDDDS